MASSHSDHAGAPAGEMHCEPPSPPAPTFLPPHRPSRTAVVSDAGSLESECLVLPLEPGTRTGTRTTRMGTGTGMGAGTGTGTEPDRRSWRRPVDDDDDKAKSNIVSESVVFEPQHPPRTFTTASTDTAVSTLAPFSSSGSCCGLALAGPVTVTVVKKPRGYELREKPRLEHNLFFIMGFMEMANAWDFAANVWNTEPVPVFALALMALGGTIAGLFSLFTMRDAWLAWRNVCFLRQQRRGLLDLRASWLKATPAASLVDIDAFLDVGHRELGTELICRFLLDLFMGFGAVLISIGTYMAIGGRNPTLYQVSNLLSGYVGNAPIALVGICISIWVAHLFIKAQTHLNAVRAVLPGTRAAELVRRRSRNMQIWCLVTGVTTILGGIGSMITATRWWGYVMLLPVIASAVFCNIWWRRRVGYARHDLVGVAGRSVYGGGKSVLDELSTALELASRAERSVRQNRAAPLAGLVSDLASLPQVVQFLAEQDLLETYCVRIVNDAQLRRALLSAAGSGSGSGSGLTAVSSAGAQQDEDGHEVSLDAASLCKLPEAHHGAAIEKAQELLRDAGPDHFRFRERHAAELLGSCACLLQAAAAAAAAATTAAAAVAAAAAIDTQTIANGEMREHRK